MALDLGPSNGRQNPHARAHPRARARDRGRGSDLDQENHPQAGGTVLRGENVAGELILDVLLLTPRDKAVERPLSQVAPGAVSARLSDYSESGVGWA